MTDKTIKCARCKTDVPFKDAEDGRALYPLSHVSFSFSEHVYVELDVCESCWSIFVNLALDFKEETTSD